MGSGGGGGSDGEGMMAMMGQGTPMPGLPVAGSEGAVSDPFEYGKFQNFLPQIQAEGTNPMATGLRPDMFKYTSPNPDGGDPAAAAAGGAAADGGRDALAATMMGRGGGGFGSAMNGVAPIPGAQQLPTPPGGWAAGNVPGWPRGGPGTPRAVEPVNSDPGAAAAYAAANAASGGGNWTPSGASGSNIGLPGDPVIAAKIAANMAAQGGPQKTNFGGVGFDFTDPRYTSRLAEGSIKDRIG